MGLIQDEATSLQINSRGRGNPQSRQEWLSLQWCGTYGEREMKSSSNKSTT